MNSKNKITLTDLLCISKRKNNTPPPKHSNNKSYLQHPLAGWMNDHSYQGNTPLYRPVKGCFGCGPKVRWTFHGIQVTRLPLYSALWQLLLRIGEPHRYCVRCPPGDAKKQRTHRERDPGTFQRQTNPAKNLWLTPEIEKKIHLDEATPLFACTCRMVARNSSISELSLSVDSRFIKTWGGDYPARSCKWLAHVWGTRKSTCSMWNVRIGQAHN